MTNSEKIRQLNAAFQEFFARVKDLELKRQAEIKNILEDIKQRKLGEMKEKFNS